MTKIYENWTEYDTWLVENYANYSIINLNEIDGKIHAEYINKDEPIPETVNEKDKKNEQ